LTRHFLEADSLHKQRDMGVVHEDVVATGLSVPFRGGPTGSTSEGGSDAVQGD